jgi:NAD(P)-dependent dehydrogenase (short-subunit alcohol dehydrogenase family)
MSELNGDVVVVTGAATGIGRALALEASRRGAVVVAADINDAADTVLAITQSGGESLAVQVDVADFTSVQRMVDQVLARYGRVNILVNNALAAKGTAPLDKADPQATKALFEVGILGVFHGIRACADSLKEQGAAQRHAYILNVGSEHSLGVPPHVMPLSTYTVSKYAVLGLTDTARRDFAGTGVHVALLAPGWVLTENIRAGMQASSHFAEAVLPYAQEPELVAQMAWDGLLAKRYLIVTNPASKGFALQHARDIVEELALQPAALAAEHGHDMANGDISGCPVAHLFQS